MKDKGSPINEHEVGMGWFKRSEVPLDSRIYLYIYILQILSILSRFPIQRLIEWLEYRSTVE